MSTKTKISRKEMGKLKLEFNKRLLKIYDKLPPDFVNMVLERLPGVKANRVINARYNRTVDFEILEVLEEIANNHK
jgi:hypothetical protein